MVTQNYRQLLRERVLARVTGSPGTCWPWPGQRNRQGYGLAWDKEAKGKKHLAHRLAFEATHGQLAEGSCVLHLCNNPCCCNPEHLIVGTRTDNARQRDAQLRMQHGERHYGARLTDAQVVEMRKRNDAGESIADIARAYGIAYKNAWKIINKKTWRNV